DIKFNKRMRGKLLTVLIFMLVWPSLSFGQVNDVVKVEFTSVARGRPFERIVVSMDSLLVTQGETTRARLVSAREWKEVRRAIKNFTFAGIQELTSPTMKRTYDGVSHSTLIIT